MTFRNNQFNAYIKTYVCKKQQQQQQLFLNPYEFNIARGDSDHIASQKPGCVEL